MFLNNTVHWMLALCGRNVSVNKWAMVWLIYSMTFFCLHYLHDIVQCSDNNNNIIMFCVTTWCFFKYNILCVHILFDIFYHTQNALIQCVIFYSVKIKFITILI